MTKRLELPKFQALDANGDPLSGGLVYTYEAGTSTPKVTYSDYANTENTNPVVLDSRGEGYILTQGSYKIVLKTSAGVTIWTLDNIEGGMGESAMDNFYYPDATAADQGVTGNSDTIKYAVDTISTDTGTIYLRHNSGAATTTYTLTTSENIGDIDLIIEDGAIIDGAGTLTIDNPQQIKAAQNQQIFGSTITLAFTTYGTVYPEWKGALGDDSNDDAAAINAFVGNDIWLAKDKTYLVKSEVSLDVNGSKLFGPGTLKADAGSFADQVHFVGITADDCIVEDITVDGDDNTKGWSIHVSSATNTRIRRVTGTNTGQAFVIIGDTAIDTYVENCYQKDEGYGVLVNDPTGSSGLFVRENHFEYDGGAGGYGDGVEINAPTNGFARFDVSNNYISGYIDAVANHGIGIGVAKGSQGVIANNIIEDVEADGIHIENESYEINIIGNNIRDTGPTAYTADGNGILVSDSFNIGIENNIIKNVNYAYGIILQAYPDEANQNYGNKVIGNTVVNVDRAGISVQGQIYFNVWGNSVYGASEETNATYSGIALRQGSASARGCENGVVAYNVIKEVTNTLAYGIDIQYVTADVHENIQVVGNDLGGCTNKFFKEPTAINIPFRDNLVVNDAFNSVTYGTGTNTLLWHEHFGHTIFVTATATITLRQSGPGMRVLVYSTTAAAVHVKAHTNDRIILDGLALDDADKVTSASGAGDFIELEHEADGWITTNRSGVWTDGGA